MKSKTLFLTSFCVLLATISLGQKKQNVYFLKNNGAFAQLRDSADYIRVIQEPDSGTTYFNLLEYYPNGTKKRVGMLSSYNPNLILEGSVISFYSSGRKKEIAVYQKGKITGPHYYYYPNGQLKINLLHINPSKAEKDLKPITKVVSFFDSTGVELVKEGTGDYEGTGDDTSLFEQGSYLDGVKNGTWKGKYLSSNNSFEEKYEMGKLISGTAFFNDGRSQPYTAIEMLPGFKGGIEKFLEYVGRNYRFPREASERGVSGKLIISFVVESDGRISNINLLKDLGYGTGEAAIKVIKESPKWIPGMQHGIPTRVHYTLPLALKTNR